MFAPKKAERPQIKIKCLLSGISGSGKTYSALLLAKEWTGGDMSKVILLNTEGERGLMNASPESPFYGYHYFDIPTPCTPEKIIQLINEIQVSGAYECIIIDSISDEWEHITKLAGDAGTSERFTVWAQLKPRHSLMLNAITNSNLHVVCTCKVKTQYEMQSYTTPNGDSKSKPVRIGSAPIQSDTIQYPFFSCLTLSSKGFNVTEDKNNSAIFQHGKSRKLDTTLAQEFLNWANAGFTKVNYYTVNIEYINAILDAVTATKPESYDKVQGALLAVQFDQVKLEKLILGYKASLKI